MNKLILAFSLIILISFSCKKKNETTADAANPSGSTTGGVQVNSGYYGQMNVLQNVIVGYPASPQNIISALFFNGPVTNQSVTTVSAGTVTVNGTTLKKDMSNPAGPAYADSTFAIPGPPFNLSATGSGSVAAFTFTYNASVPEIADTSHIPSVITRSLGLSITFTNVPVTDSLAFNIAAGSGNVTKQFAVSNNQALVNFTAAELNSLSATSNGGSITINLLRNQLVNSNSKNYLIQLEKRYFKIMVQVN